MMRPTARLATPVHGSLHNNTARARFAAGTNRLTMSWGRKLQLPVGLSSHSASSFANTKCSKSSNRTASAVSVAACAFVCLSTAMYAGRRRGLQPHVLADQQASGSRVSALVAVPVAVTVDPRNRERKRLIADK